MVLKRSTPQACIKLDTEIKGVCNCSSASLALGLSPPSKTDPLPLPVLWFRMLLVPYAVATLCNWAYGCPSSLLAAGTPARPSGSDKLPISAEFRELQSPVVFNLAGTKPHESKGHLNQTIHLVPLDSPKERISTPSLPIPGHLTAYIFLCRESAGGGGNPNIPKPRI